VRETTWLLPRHSVTRRLLLPPDLILDAPERTDVNDSARLALLRGEQVTVV
jgi:hypothetical protein